jgi:hypothetical protein
MFRTTLAAGVGLLACACASLTTSSALLDAEKAFAAVEATVDAAALAADAGVKSGALTPAQDAKVAADAKAVAAAMAEGQAAVKAANAGNIVAATTALAALAASLENDIK